MVPSAKNKFLGGLGVEGRTSLNTDTATGRCINHTQEIEVGSASV